MQIQKMGNGVNFGKIQNEYRDEIIAKSPFTPGLEEKQIKAFDKSDKVILKYDPKSGIVYYEAKNGEKGSVSDKLSIIDAYVAALPKNKIPEAYAENMAYEALSRTFDDPEPPCFDDEPPCFD